MTPLGGSDYRWDELIIYTYTRVKVAMREDRAGGEPPWRYNVRNIRHRVGRTPGKAARFCCVEPSNNTPPSAHKLPGSFSSRRSSRPRVRPACTATDETLRRHAAFPHTARRSPQHLRPSPLPSSSLPEFRLHPRTPHTYTTYTHTTYTYYYVVYIYIGVQDVSPATLLFQIRMQLDGKNEFPLFWFSNRYFIWIPKYGNKIHKTKFYRRDKKNCANLTWNWTKNLTFFIRKVECIWDNQNFPKNVIL